ncbi:hypothetical protein [Nonomuraea jabiensis]|uniref:hypothetical protein n=1 Tax=Nonomuraea jabiensis TaxID=882448 RepID=UPI003D704364
MVVEAVQRGQVTMGGGVGQAQEALDGQLAPAPHGLLDVGDRHRRTWCGSFGGSEGRGRLPDSGWRARRG